MLAEHRPEERTEEGVHELLAELEPAEPVVGGLVGTGEELVQRARPGVGAQAHHAELVPEGTEWRGRGPSRVERAPERVGERVERPATKDLDTGGEAAEPERVEVQHAARFGVRGQEDLEAAIDAKPVHQVGADAPTRSVARLEHLHAHAGRHERARAGEPGQPCSDHDHATVRHAEAAPFDAGRTRVIHAAGPVEAARPDDG